MEIKGRARLDPPLTSYLAKASCVYYTWSVEERWSRWVTESYTDSKGNRRTRMKRESGWTTVAEGGEISPFFLEDDTGLVLVRPSGAKLDVLEIFDETCDPDDSLYYDKGPEEEISHSDHVRRFHETAIPVGTPLFVVGQARERRDTVAPEIAADARAPMFLITVRDERQVTGGYTGWSWFLAILGLILLVASFFVADAVGYRRGFRFFPDQAIATVGLSIVSYLAAAWIGWVWMVYNAMVNLRQRVRQAWSLVDIQLKRRHDLIPNLLRAVEGLRDHERTLQVEIADLRAQLAATPPGDPGPDPHAILPGLRAIAERYPELKAQEAFLNLQEELSKTEQRIALARAYFNDIATFFNTRIEVVPDGWVAGLARMGPRKLLEAADFERAPVPVRIAKDPA